MRKGEKGILIAMLVIVGGMATLKMVAQQKQASPGDTEIPFYSTASPELEKEATRLIRELNCRSCHSMWTVRSPLQSVPAPPLDGMGSLRSEEWLYEYFSAEDPQRILPSRLKAEYQMPSYADLPEEERRVLARYMASLKVKDWYLEETKKREREKLMGQEQAVPEESTP